MFELFRKDKKKQNTDRMKELVELCKHNCREVYEKLWNDEELVKTYLEPARVESYNVILEYLIRQDCGGKILELGFGSGYFLHLLVQKIPKGIIDIYGLDYAESAVRRANKLIPKGKFVLGDVYSLPYPSDFFDWVFSIQTLEHLERPEHAIDEMDRVCKREGIILISVPNGELDTYEGHRNFWNETELKKLLDPRQILSFTAYNENRGLMAFIRPPKDGR